MAAARRKTKSTFKSILYFIGVIIVVLGIYFGLFDDSGLGFSNKLKSELGSVSEVGDGDIQVHMIDVGQADCLLVRIPEGNTVKNILIDAGTSENHTSDVVTDYLTSCGIKEIEYFIVTHPHLDHIGAATAVVKNFTVKNVIIPDCEYSTSTWTKFLTALDSGNINTVFSEVGKTYSVGEASFRILAPSANMLAGDEANNYSIVIRLVYKDTSFMFTGDAHTESEAEILKTFSASELKCNVLKVGHHGSSSSTSQEFLDAVDPDIALISLGAGNSYGHPHKETLAKLNSSEITVLRTDELGTVVLVSDGKTVSRLNK